MPLRRRLLPLALVPLLAPVSAWAADDLGAETPSVTLAGLRVPASRARLLSTGTMGGTEVSLVAFAADPSHGALDLLALGANGWVLALEPLSWSSVLPIPGSGPEGEHLHTRPTLVTDHLRVRLERTASVPVDGGPGGSSPTGSSKDGSGRKGRFRHESWTDYLLWSDGGLLRDDPVRAPLPGTCQAALARTRLSLRRMISVGLHGVPTALLEACPLPTLSG